MKSTRRAVVASAATAAVPLSGCGFLTSDTLSFAASAATVTGDALSETGYEEVRVTSRTIERDFSAVGQTKTVEVTNRIAQYDRRVDVPGLPAQRLAAFMVYASPEVEVLGQTFNPLEKMDNRDLLERLDSSYEGLEIGERVGTREVTALGTGTSLERYEGSATAGGQSVDVYVEITKVNHEGDWVVAVALYPQVLDGEGDRVRTLVEGVRHDGGG